MKNKLKTKKYIKLIKNNKKSKKILVGGENPIKGDDYKGYLEERVLKTYNFLPCLPDGCVNVEQSTLDYGELVFDINKMDNVSYEYTHEEDLTKYELYYPDYHGAHEINVPKILPDNCYLCIFGFFDTSSWILPNRMMSSFMDFANFFKKMSKNDFDIICKYKSLLGSPELKHKINIKEFPLLKGNAMMDCFLKASWVFPKQQYYDITFSIEEEGIGDKGIKLVHTYYNKYKPSSSKLEKKILKNQTTIDGIDSFIQYIMPLREDDKSDKKYIIFVDACRSYAIGKTPTTGATAPLIININEMFYRNQSLNYAIYKSIFPTIGSDEYDQISKLKKGLCSSDWGNYKSIFATPITSEFSNRNYNFYKPLNKNDNLHPLIPKLRYLYDTLLVLTPTTIESYFKTNYYNLYFIITLSFNKLRKFLVKVREMGGDDICKAIIKCIKNNKECVKLLTYYNISYKNMLDKYNTWSDTDANIYHNFKLCSFLFDFLELSYLFNSSDIMSAQIKQIQDTPFSNIFALNSTIIVPKNVKYYSKTIKMNGYMSNPFILPIVSKNIFKNVTVFEAVRCFPYFTNKFTFDNISYNKLQSLNIDDTAFAFTYMGNSPSLNDILTKCFRQDKETAKEIKINNFISSADAEDIKFSNFKIICFNFNFNPNNVFQINTEIVIENCAEIELIKFSDCFFTKALHIENSVKKINCLSLNNIKNFKPISLNNTITKLIGLELCDINYNDNLFDKQKDILMGLNVLKLNNVRHDPNKIKINLNGILLDKLEVLEIKHSILYNINFNISKIKNLNLIAATIINDDPPDINNMRIDCIDNLNIKIVASKIPSFHFYIKKTIKNSTISIEESDLCNNCPEIIIIGRIKYYKLKPTAYKHDKKRKNKIKYMIQNKK